MKENTIGHIEEKERFRRLDTIKGAERRTLRAADALWKRVWDKLVPRSPEDTFSSLKHGKIKVERHEQEGGDFVV